LSVHLRSKLLVVLLIVALGGAAAVLFVRRRQPKLYQITILPSLGGKLTNPTGINNRGQIVGFAEAADGTIHLFLWERQTGMEDLGPAMQTAFYINDAGQIAGTMQDPNGRGLAFLWDRTSELRTLGTLGGPESRALGLNNHGKAVGWSHTADGAKHAFVWDEAGGMRDLGTAGGTQSEAHAINDAGQIVGVSIRANRPQRQPVLWTSAGTVVETSLARMDTGRLDINGEGYVPGRQWFRGEGDALVLWRSGSDPQRLLRLDDRIQRGPVINDANQVLFSQLRWHWFEPDGTKFTDPWIEHYLWDPTRGNIRLDACVPAEKGETLILADLNNRGCIVGVLRSGPRLAHGRPVLLEPIPERWER
jgi:probable HAF family extracellular repeat protein